MPQDPVQLSASAVAIARDAANLARVRRAEVFGANAFGGADGTSDAVATKSTATDPVAIVDTETERFVRKQLNAQRPGDAVLGEEFGDGALGEWTEVESNDRVRWVVDPIDGTVNFLYGVPAYAVSLAAQIAGESIAGAVADVVTGTVYTAARGHGAREIRPDGTSRPLQANPITDPSLALVATGFGYSPARRTRQGAIAAGLLPLVRDLRRIGSAALDLCMVATGQVDAHYEHGLSPWDWAAGALIAAEAGATVLLPGPNATSDDGLITVAAAPGISDEFIELLRRVGGLAPV